MVEAMKHSLPGRAWRVLVRHLGRAAGGSAPLPSRPPSARGTRRMAAVLLATSVLTVPVAAQGAPGDVGSEGPSHAGTGTPTGAKRAESVLWFNDGYWWGNLWDT